MSDDALVCFFYLEDLASMNSFSQPKLLPVLSPSNNAWDYHVENFKLPPYTRIMLADVDAGSDTPSLVGKVLKWRKEKSIEGKSCLSPPCSYNSHLLLADALWKHLNQLNQSLAQTLLHLSKLHDQDPENYKNAVKYISSLHSVQASPFTSHLEMVNPFAF